MEESYIKTKEGLLLWESITPSSAMGEVNRTFNPPVPVYPKSNKVGEHWMHDFTELLADSAKTQLKATMHFTIEAVEAVSTPAGNFTEITKAFFRCGFLFVASHFYELHENARITFKSHRTENRRLLLQLVLVSRSGWRGCQPHAISSQCENYPCYLRRAGQPRLCVARFRNGRRCRAGRHLSF
jgi:hypothetical protein